MNATGARFSVQRQDTNEGDWRPLTSCNSLDYARMVATAGRRRHISASYRAIETETGVGFSLGPELPAKAA
jgi:hypothetical protein